MTRWRFGVTLVFLAPLLGSFLACGGGGTGPTPPPPPPPPPPPVTVSLTALSVTPQSVAGCGPAQLTATLSGAAPSGGATVMVTAAPQASLTVSNITIAAGATTGNAAVTQPTSPTASTVAAPTAVTLTGNLAAGTGLSASTQTATLNLAAPIAAFTVSRTAGGTTIADECQVTNSTGSGLDCTFNGGGSTGATLWDWAWQIGGTTRTATGRPTPTLQPDTGNCGFFNATGGQVMMRVRLEVRDAASNKSCLRESLNVRVRSGGNCGGGF